MRSVYTPWKSRGAGCSIPGRYRGKTKIQKQNGVRLQLRDKLGGQDMATDPCPRMRVLSHICHVHSTHTYVCTHIILPDGSQRVQVQARSHSSCWGSMGSLGCPPPWVIFPCPWVLRKLGSGPPPYRKWLCVHLALLPNCPQQEANLTLSWEHRTSLLNQLTLTLRDPL